ncbi:uncharacterized protein LOC124135766 isoform X2 [Haliotis rufescens]|uniref:uncharacterized protein LOC124135766 isoform X2 n=1 Tax=Haliotis rufescens TaxID=6454 RepID=UPI00201EDDBC|nr:uncharacterized protein LOC124135766 isoform X2 [Haliotis rufescens]
MMAENQAIYQMGITPGMEYIMGPEGSQAEQEALREDKDQSYRVILNIVGRERQGKTSLRKMLAWQEFSENEESTVGIDHELVETCGVQPESSWSQLDMHMANEKEFDVIIGKHVLKRLKKKASRISIEKVVAPVVCFAKIAAVTYLILGLYLSAVSLEGLKGYPWVGIVVIGLFCASGLAFGTREGFGIAVGIFHQVLLCEALLRWDVGGTVFKKLKSEFGSTCAIFMGFLCYGIGETCVAFSFGMSLGVGIVCTFCLAHPPQTTGENPSQLFLSPHLHMFIFGCYVGLGSVNYRSVLLYVIAPLLAIAIHALPEDYAFLLMCGLGTGHFHGVGLSAGQNTYYILNTNIKRITDSPRCRRFIRHFLGATPGLFMIYLFNWNLSVISWDYVFMSLSVVATIEILNSLATRTKALCPVKNPSKVIGARVFNTSLKLVLRDFAGHPLYYTAHHLYMTGQCMYLLVFNMLDATKDFDLAFAYLLQWLYSIYVHHDYPDIRVFIIGTHRNDPSLNQSVIMKLGHRLKEALPRQFHNIVVWNEDDTPLFPVENSTGFHILSLGDDDFHDEDTNNQRLMTKHYWCRGRKVAIRNGKASLLLGQERQVFSPDGCKMTTQLSDLPYTVTGRVCDYLNIPNALGKDWRYLAGMLGKTSHEVDLITFRCPRDPCGALLNEWVSTHPRTSVADLVIKLKDMERLDVISILGFDWENV